MDEERVFSTECTRKSVLDEYRNNVTVQICW